MYQKSYIIRKAANLAQSLFGGKRGRSFVPEKSDTFIVSYPKSGNTWIRIVLARLISGNPDLSLSAMDSIIPNIDSQLIPEANRVPGPGMYKSHMPYNKDFRKVVYITRDPRDVLVSYYFHQVRNNEFRGSIREFSDWFISEDQPFRNWSENVGSWIGGRSGSDDFLWIRYEDLVTKPHLKMLEILKFIGLGIQGDEIEQVLAKSTIGELRRAEEKDSNWKGSSSAEKHTSFFRRGGSHWMKDEENRDIYARIRIAFKSVMDTCGYGSNEVRE